MPAGFLRHHQVDEFGVAVRQLIGVITTLARCFAHFFVTQVGQVGVVHLHIGAAGSGQAAQFFAIGVGHVLVKIGVQLWVMLFADACPAATEMQHGGGGDGDLGGVALADLAFEVLEVGQLDVFDMAHFVHHFHDRRRKFLRAVGLDDGDRDVTAPVRPPASRRRA